MRKYIPVVIFFRVESPPFWVPFRSGKFYSTLHTSGSYPNCRTPILTEHRPQDETSIYLFLPGIKPSTNSPISTFPIRMR